MRLRVGGTDLLDKDQDSLEIMVFVHLSRKLPWRKDDSWHIHYSKKLLHYNLRIVCLP